MSLFKKVLGQAAGYAARKTTDKAKQTARDAAMVLERALYGEREEGTEPASSKGAAAQGDGGELGRYAEKKRREEREARAKEKTGK